MILSSFSKLFKKFKKFNVSIRDVTNLIKKDANYFENNEIRNFGGNKNKNKNHILKALLSIFQMEICFILRVENFFLKMFGNTFFKSKKYLCLI